MKWTWLDWSGFLPIWALAMVASASFVVFTIGGLIARIVLFLRYGEWPTSFCELTTTARQQGIQINLDACQTVETGWLGIDKSIVWGLQTVDVSLLGIVIALLAFATMFIWFVVFGWLTAEFR